MDSIKMDTSGDLRKNNEIKIINTLYTNDKMTKKQIKDRTKLTLMTVNKIVNDLVKRNLVVEEGVAESETGRKANYYRLNEDLYYVIALNIGLDKITAVISNLRMRIVEEISINIQDKNNTVEIVKSIIYCINELIDADKVPQNKIVGLGISMRGHIDTKSGTVISEPRGAIWSNFKIIEKLKEHITIPLIVVDRDTYTDALYLKWCDPVENEGAIVISVRGGIGAGILRQGKLYRGHNNLAGQIGHSTIDIDGPRCECGNFGCLEVFASDYAIENKIITKLKEGEKSSILDLINGDVNEINIDTIIKAAKYKDELCLNVLNKATRYMGASISNIIKLYDPTSIIIDCRWINEIDELFNKLREEVYRSINLISKDKIIVKRCCYKNMRIKGTIVLILDYLFDNIHSLENLVNSKT